MDRKIYKPTKEELEEDIKYHTSKELAKKYGIHDSTVLVYVKKYGIKIPLKYRSIKKFIGKKFGRLLVESVDESSLYITTEMGYQRAAKYNCICDCGNKCLISEKTLKDGRTQSCGCYANECRFIVNWKGCGEIGSTYWSTIINGAKYRKLEFNITIEQAWEIFQKQKRKCAFTGVELSFRRHIKGPKGTASLDRIDSSKGYTIDNIQWVHKKINIMKQDLSDEEFINWCELIVANRKKKDE